MAETTVPEKAFTPEDKFECAEREVKMRRTVYRRRVEAGWMTQQQADREIALMEAIADDYRPQRLL